ncbi:MAG TPA: beta-L-arabinofuranosidase domain-containing protein, partial [Verrucomicrobiae bacterium]
MKQSTWFMGGVLGLTLAALVSRSTAVPVSDYPVQPVPFTRVHLHDDFWAPRIETNRLFTIPFAFEQCEKSGRMDNFERAAKILRGEPLANRQPPGYPFDDTDPYKVLEGASYVLAVQPDAKLKAYLDALIAKIAAAQEPDGYLYTARTIDPEHPHAWSGQQRWLRDPDQSHELYDSGHLFEAAVAHYQATGETNLLTVATRNADLLCRTFGTGSNQLNHLWPGHEIVEMGLAKLYRATGKEEYLQLAKFFIDTRGPGGDEYHQSHIKPVDQRAAVGHAVRASYLYSGMADVAAMTGDTAYTAAIDAIWENVAYKKLYITGGIGARGEGEAFGPDYFLPNMSAYSETCAAVGNDYWNARLFLFHGDARYMDVFERTLYNGLLAGVSLDGKGFFYPNPLESIGQHSRSPWFGCACCPGNITRFLPSLPGYFYAHQADQLYVNLYASSSAEIPLSADQIIALEQTTRYPWAGAIRLTVTPKTGSPEFALKLRIPDWARNEASPGDLYHFTDTNTEP